MNTRILFWLAILAVAFPLALYLEDIIIICQSILPHWMNAAIDRFLDWLLNDIFGAGDWSDVQSSSEYSQSPM